MYCAMLMAKMGTKDMDKENEMAKQLDKEREEKIRREIAKRSRGDPGYGDG